MQDDPRSPASTGLDIRAFAILIGLYGMESHRCTQALARDALPLRVPFRPLSPQRSFLIIGGLVIQHFWPCSADGRKLRKVATMW